MANETTCLKCGTPLAADARQGFCPRCLFVQASSGDFDNASVAGQSEPPKALSDEKPRSTDHASAFTTAGLELPRTFGDYELLEEVARGGMGIVYRARQMSLDRIVAVKMLLFGPLSSPEFVKRFRAEASAAASLQHPNIVAIHEVGVHQGQQYFAMDYVEGQSLAKLISDFGFRISDFKRAARYLKTITEAIHYAHERGILHRDLKLSNVLIDARDQPRVTDFGLARRLEGVSELTVTGQVLGSPNYMPPEQATAKRGKVSRRSDVYSLGAMLYHVLTGRPPFVGEALTDTLEQVLNTDPVSPRLLNPSLPRDLETICLKCLEKEPDKRYPTAQALADEFSRFLNNEPVHARPVTGAERIWRWCRRKPALASLIAAISLLLLAILIGSPIAALRIDRARKLAEVRLYAADMSAAQQALEDGNLGRTRDLLKAHWPKPGQPDLRGFEWRYLWNLCQGDNFHTFPGHSHFVQCVAFSPDGKTLASGSRDHTVKLWDVANRGLVATLPAHSDCVAWLAFSNDGRTLATAGDDGLIKFWNVKTDQLIFNLKENAARIAFSPLGTLLAIGTSSTFDGRPGDPMKLWDYETRRVVRTFPESGSRLAFSPDGKTLAARSGNDAVKIWNVETGEEMRKLNNAGEVLCLAFSPGGEALATGNWAGEVQLWNVATGERGMSLKGHTGAVWSLAFSPDGKSLATGSSDQTVRFWNVTTGKEESKLIGHGSEVWAVAFARDGQTLATGGKDAMVMLWSTVSKAEAAVFTNVAAAPVFSPDGQFMAAAGTIRRVTLWQVTNHQVMWVLTNALDAVGFSRDSQTLLTIGTNFSLQFWHVRSGKLRRSIPLSGDVTNYNLVALAPGRNLLVSSLSGSPRIRLWDTETGRMKANFVADAVGGSNGETRPESALADSPSAINRYDEVWPVIALAFSPNGDILATATSGHLVKLWDVATQKELAAVSGHRDWIHGLAFSPDGSVLASGSWDDTVGFLRVATGKAEAPLTGIKEGCSGVAFSPDGRTLALACEDGTVKLWNVVTKREVAVLRHGTSPVYFVVFAPDGQTLVSIGENGTMRFWDAPNPTLPNHE